MRKLLLVTLICVIAGFSFLGCGKHTGSEHPSSGHEHPKSEHPK